MICLRYTHAYQTYSVLLSCVLRACSRRANWSQQKTGRPVSRLRGMRRVCDHQKKYFQLACISLLGSCLARRPLVVPRTTGCKRGLSREACDNWKTGDDFKSNDDWSLLIPEYEEW